MKIAVYDTYVAKKDGTVLHFDILVPDELKDEMVIHGFGKEYLKNKGQEGSCLRAGNANSAMWSRQRKRCLPTLMQKATPLLKCKDATCKQWINDKHLKI